MVRIDPTDFEATLAQEQSNLATARRVLAEEEIRAQQAASDWKASGRELSRASDFVLRKPQLAAARATIQSVRASIEKALADLERTTIKAPFDAIVTERSASMTELRHIGRERSRAPSPLLIVISPPSLLLKSKHLSPLLLHLRSAPL